MQPGKVLSQAQWTKLRNDLLTNDTLARRGYEVGIDECVITAESTSTVSSKMTATTLEAIIGAVYADGGDSAVQRVMEHIGFFNHNLFTVMFRLLSSPP
jgi:ribonuclease-3